MSKLNPILLPLAAFIVLFAIAFIDSLFVENYTYQNWFSSLSGVGKICVILCFGCIPWFFAEAIGFKKKRK